MRNNTSVVRSHGLVALETCPDSEPDFEVCHTDIPSNERLLGTAFVSFMTFALVQMIFAFVAGSQAMVGDSAAMIVDALTYLFNWIAEIRKNRFDELYSETTNNRDNPRLAKRLREREKRKMLLQLEIIPPLISVSTLIVVIFFVLRRAVKVLWLDMHRKRSEQLTPNVNLMLAFSVLNLGLDILNVFCFAKAKHLMGFATMEDPHHHQASVDPQQRSSPMARRTAQLQSYARVVAGDSEEIDPETGEGVPALVSPSNSSDSSNDDEHHYRLHENNGDDSLDSDESTDGEERANLNMCSAYTHVFADTLRSLAVILASGVAELSPTVTPEVADSTAAVVVSVLILLSLIPLFQGLLHSIAELQSIRAEERSETMFAVNARQIS